MTSAASALAVAAPFCYSTSATICTDDEPMALETYGQPQQLPPPQPQPNKTAALRLFRPFTASRSIMPSLSGTTTRSASGDKLFSAKSSLPNPWSFSFYEEDRNEDPLSRGQSRATMATSMYTVATRAQRNTHHLDLYRSAVRSLTLRKIKEKAVNEPLVQIGRYATKVNKLDLYICDYLSNEVLFGFAAHGTLTYLSLAGCNRITDEAILYVAHHCRNLEHLDLRACGLISDKSISAIAMHCPQLRHLNVGRVRDRERITIKSIGLIAQHTQVAVLGLAGCDITDECLITLAMYRNNGLERISVNSCYRITNKSIRAYVEYCPRLSVFEMKECHQINDWNAVADLVQRKVLLTLCDQQNRACAEWAKRMGRVIHVKAPLK
ncbi:uncharacterized protein BYT42DRAFT_546035 [Radiomyces spectabilis]|uniref:uncharacterized protein n=1 Tax=Radiomyces spectabilis TaxID=64574 RepID=UPI00221EC1B9|nr:uncharacterized protein BYT42DRAFT_546035 [Radiomyces spectabilis]KAI8379729.1 hypothetical protein BYT42DRAFT_546035 [Radiomyces spectabilis]